MQGNAFAYTCMFLNVGFPVLKSFLGESRGEKYIQNKDARELELDYAAPIAESHVKNSWNKSSGLSVDFMYKDNRTSFRIVALSISLIDEMDECRRGG